MSSPDATGYSSFDGDLTREQAASDLLTVTRGNYQAALDHAVGLERVAQARTMVHLKTLLHRALVRLCEQGDSALSSALVREIRDTLGH